ncbi:MAG: aldehyde dehydrogenase family protein [Proteobacteria bacterium]|nr:aldehyde dehydrogenase family protein [Pseudomonadota bacterium]
MELEALVGSLGIPPGARSNGDLSVRSPVDGRQLAALPSSRPAEVHAAVEQAQEAFRDWRRVPAPVRGELVRLFGQELRAAKPLLGRLVTLESGKILQEGLGEVQEMIDICDFSVGLSRQLYGLTLASERPEHRMLETWHPLGPVAVISAFNFPVAVWSWNFALAIVCGDPVIWKPSEKTPLCALACQQIFGKALQRFELAPDHLSQVLIGTAELGAVLVDHEAIPLVSATGSCRMGAAVAPRVARRFGRCLLELGGNNAMIAAPSADLDLAVRAIVFSALGTAGQRCTSLRRLIVHESVQEDLVARLKTAYASAVVGSPLETETLVGPLIDGSAFHTMQQALALARRDGGKVSGGERVLADRFPDAYYVRPALVEMPAQTEIVKEETFAPILYVMTYREWDEAMEMHNGVSQGLSSCIFTRDVREAELFLSAEGSDCGIANVNIGPSGAEIGGAFGGEKATGGGREAGSDSWKSYMRRGTNTINYSSKLPLAQGIEFG